MKVWGLAATLGFSILAFGLGQLLGFEALEAVKPIDPLHVDTDGTAVAIVTLIGDPVQVVTLVLAARLTGTDILTYFGLIVPRWRDAALAVMALAGAIVLGDVLTFALGHDIVPSFQLDIHRSAKADGTLALLWLALIVAAPIGEELMFRGFLFRGLVHEPRDGLPGILAIALIWALLHIQYDWVGTGMVFAVGVLFGYVRLYTGSTLLVIFLHMLLNLESLAETVFALGGI
jgi:CAAX protease family protein